VVAGIRRQKGNLCRIVARLRRVGQLRKLL
jgi:hypothetical protein